MVKNNKGGKNYKKYKNKPPPIRDLLIAENNQCYATITKMLGDGRCLGNISDGKTDVLCIIRGNMRKKVWINIGDVVLGSYRICDSGKTIIDIIHKYQSSEIQQLKKMKHLIPQEQNINKEINITYDEDETFVFEDL